MLTSYRRAHNVEDSEGPPLNAVTLCTDTSTSGCEPFNIIVVYGKPGLHVKSCNVVSILKFG